jgi:hypothetical protein
VDWARDTIDNCELETGGIADMRRAARLEALQL